MDYFKTALILAGGKSSRMEFDKQLLVINEQRLIFNIAKNLEKHFEHIIIVSNKKEIYKDCKYDVVSDEIKDSGPLAGISVGLNHSKSEFVYIVACDMPNIDDKYINSIKSRIKKDIVDRIEYDVYLSQIDNKTQLFNGFYKRELGHEIKKYLINDTKKSILSFIENTDKRVNYIDEVEFLKNSFDKDMFINLNTQEDLNRYKSIK